MELNPELRRNLWLELTLHRLIAMPVVLLMVFAMIQFAGEDGAEKVAVAAAWIAGLLLGVWGVRNAGDCVLEEVRARTWDAQRLSAIGPWSMTWSKLLGSVSFAWYGGLIALAVLLACAPRDWPVSAAMVAAMIVAGSVLAQAAASLAGLAAARKGHARRGGAGLWLLVVLLVFVGPGVLGMAFSRDTGWQWWGHTYERWVFMLASATCFAAWAVFGLYRSMCTELQVRTRPWAFALFLLFLAGYLAGFWIAPGAGNRIVLYALILSAMAVSGAMTYLQLFTEETGVIVFRRVQVRVVRREWRRALEELPCWPIAFAMAAAACVTAQLVLPASIGDNEMRRLFAAPVPLFLLLLRDVGIFLFFAFARQSRRVEAAMVFYLVMLYWVVPGLATLAGWEGLAQFLLPVLFESAGAAIGVAALHAGAGIALLAWRWRGYRIGGGQA
jgi:hypothetical protein